jgi:hypothetical protein
MYSCYLFTFISVNQEMKRRKVGTEIIADSMYRLFLFCLFFGEGKSLVICSNHDVGNRLPCRASLNLCEMMEDDGSFSRDSSGFILNF